MQNYYQTNNKHFLSNNFIAHFFCKRPHERHKSKGIYYMVEKTSWIDFKKINVFKLEANYFIILWWFCHTMTHISHRCTCVPHPEPLFHLLPHRIRLGCPWAPALSALLHASNLHWSSILHMVIYIFQCYSLKLSHPHLLPHSPKVCSLHLCLFCCLAYRIVITIFLNSIYMC